MIFVRSFFLKSVGFLGMEGMDRDGNRDGGVGKGGGGKEGRNEQLF